MQRTIYSEDHEAFRASVREFLDRSVWPNVDSYIENKALPRDYWLEAGEQGLLGLEIPEEFGGLGAEDFRFNAVLSEELARVNAAIPSCHGIHSDITIPYVVKLGTQAQKERWLPGAATGEVVTAIGMTEPSGGSDLAALKTTAVRDGDGWVLNGSKTFITNGYSCDMVIVAARTSPEKKARGISLFAVDTSLEGFSRGRKLDKVGQDEADTAEMFFENIRLTDDDIIGELDGGFIHMMQMLPQERLQCAIVSLYHADQILIETIQYAHDRKAFGQSIGNFQYNKFKMAEMVTKVDVTRAFLDQCVALHSEGKLTAIDAAKAKWWASDTQGEILDACVQLHGGYGYMNEYRAARAWRDGRVQRIWAGSNEIMKELIGRDLGF
jgi:alkylation response protein AidB-like acyl-CoA dehydrogenase